MNFNQSWIVFLLLGASALSWVFGKIKENAEAEEAKKRAQLQRQRTQDQGSQGSTTGTPENGRSALEQQATQRKQQLAQLRQERLTALRAQMAARLESSQQALQSAPARQQPAKRPAARSIAASVQQPQQTRANVATMRKPPSVSHDRAKLSNLGTHTQHADHKDRDKGVHRLVTDAETTSVDHGSDRSSPLGRLTLKDWRRAIILSEVLAPPVSLRAEG